MDSSCLVRVVSSDVRHNFLLYDLAAAAVLLLTPVLFGLAELNSRMAALPLEIMPPLMGMILMTPLFSPEQNEGILETVRAKKMSRHIVTLLRLICALVLLAGFIGILGGYMRLNDCEVTAKMCAGAFAGAAALGALGFFAAGVSDNIVIGYMVSMMYYITSLFLKKELGKFCLLSMSCGIKGSKPLLAVTAAVLIAAAMIFRRICKNER